MIQALEVVTKGGELLCSGVEWSGVESEWVSTFSSYLTKAAIIQPGG